MVVLGEVDAVLMALRSKGVGVPVSLGELVDVSGLDEVVVIRVLELLSERGDVMSARYGRWLVLE